MEAENHPRKTWIAVALTLLMPGLGHIYNGQLRKGLIIYFLIHIIWIGVLSVLLIRSLIPFNLLFAVLLLIYIYVFLIARVVSHAKAEGKGYELRPFNIWYVYLAMIALSMYVIEPLYSSVLRANLIEFYIVPTGAMEKTILVGDYIIGDMRKRNIPTLEQGDVVIFRYPHDPTEKYVKRLVAGPGQEIKIIDREIIVDGEPFNDPEQVQFLDRQPKPAGQSDPNIFPRGNGNKDYYGPVRIPARGDTLSAVTERDVLWYVAKMDGHQLHVQGSRLILDGEPIAYYQVEQDYYFMMGDNRDQSFDSRFWGFVPHHYILGEALYVYFSINMKRFPFVTWERIKRIGTFIR